MSQDGSTPSGEGGSSGAEIGRTGGAETAGTINAAGVGGGNSTTSTGAVAVAEGGGGAAGEAGVPAGGAAGDDTAPLPAGGTAGAQPAGGASPTCAPSAEVCDGVDNDCNGAVDDSATIAGLCAQESVCLDGSCVSLPVDGSCVGVQYATHAYAYCSLALDWATAQSYCETLGAHLATITSAAEDAALKSLLVKQEDAWIGLDRAATCEWTWVTGEPVSYTAWPVNFPDGSCGAYDCVQLWGQRDAQWDDTYCTDEQRFLCEWEPDP